MAAGVRRDGLGIGNGQNQYFLRFPSHDHVSHGIVKGPKRRGIATGPARGVRNAF
jgi:hypothetical protein